MGADKARHVRDTGAEMLVAGDNSCLMHIGGLLSRQRSGVRTVHLAEILASTEDPAAPRPRRGRTGMTAAPSSACRPSPRPPARRSATPSCGTTSPTPPAPSATSGPGSSPRSRTGRSCASPEPRSRSARCATSTTHLEPLEASLTAGGRDRPLGPRRRRGLRDRRPDRPRPRGRRGRQGQVDGHPGDRPQRGARGRGHRRLGDRPRRADRAARRRPALATSWCRRSTATGPRSARSSVAEMADVGRPAPDDLTDEPAVLAAAARAAPAREVPARQGRRLRRQLRRRRHRHPGRGRVRGQRPDVPDPARGAGLASSASRRSCRPGRDLDPLLQPAAAVLDRRADEPLHLDVDRRHARRRPAGGARRAARQRPHPRAGRRRRPPGAALHPVLGLPQRVPGLRAHRRPRLRLGLPRPDRRDPQPAAARRRRDEQIDSLPYASSLCGACFEVCPVRIDIPSVLVDLRAQVVDAHRGDRARSPRRWR